MSTGAFLERVDSEVAARLSLTHGALKQANGIFSSTKRERFHAKSGAGL